MKYADYVINIKRSPESDWDPVATAFTEKDAIDKAEDYAATAYSAEVVYSPCNNMKVDRVVFRTRA